MSWLKVFRARKEAEPPPPAAQAKERLQIVLAHERISRTRDDFLPKLQQELVAVVARYVAIDPGKVAINLDRGGDISTLEIEIELPGPQGVLQVTAGPGAAAAGRAAAG
jgi:cell division topological specificity factor